MKKAETNRKELFSSKSLIEKLVLVESSKMVVKAYLKASDVAPKALSTEEKQYIEWIKHILDANRDLIKTLIVPIFGYDWNAMMVDKKVDSDTAEKLSKITTFIEDFTVHVSDEYLNVTHGYYVDLFQQQKDLKKPRIDAKEEFTELIQLATSVKKAIDLNKNIIKNACEKIVNNMQKFLEPSKSIGTKFYHAIMKSKPMASIKEEVEQLALCKNQMSNEDISNMNGYVQEINNNLFKTKEINRILQTEIETVLKNISEAKPVISSKFPKMFWRK